MPWNDLEKWIGVTSEERFPRDQGKNWLRNHGRSSLWKSGGRLKKFASHTERMETYIVYNSRSVAGWPRREVLTTSTHTDRSFEEK